LGLVLRGRATADVRPDPLEPTLFSRPAARSRGSCLACGPELPGHPADFRAGARAAAARRTILCPALLGLRSRLSSRSDGPGALSPCDRCALLDRDRDAADLRAYGEIA